MDNAKRFMIGLVVSSVLCAWIVLMLHNGHAQQVPMQLLPGFQARSTGTYLTAETLSTRNHRT